MNDRQENVEEDTHLNRSEKVFGPDVGQFWQIRHISLEHLNETLASLKAVLVQNYDQSVIQS